jgi:hypothetical protein
MKPFYEGQNHSFYAISAQAETALAGLADGEWDDFLVAADVFEGSRASGRPPGRVVVEVNEDLFVLDATVFGSASRFVCARRGRQVLVAQVVGRRRQVGQREVAAASDALRIWRRANRTRRSDVLHP